MTKLLASAILAATLLPLACAQARQYEEGKYIIWSGRGAILTASPVAAPADWAISSDPAINERVEIVNAAPKSTDRLLQAPKLPGESAQAHQPNFLSEAEVATLQGKAQRAEADQAFEKAARLWDYLAVDRPSNATFALMAAKAWARAGNATQAIAASRMAWARGFDDLISFRNDLAFKSIENDRAWQSMLIEFEVRAERAGD